MEKICISIPCFGIIRLQKIPETIWKTIVYCCWKQWPIVLQQIVITCFGISDQFSYSVQELMLKNDTLKSSTSRIFLWKCPPPPRGPCRFMTTKSFVKEVRLKVQFLELSQKAFMKMKHFWKHQWRIQFFLNVWKGLTLRAPKSLVFRGRFFQIYMGDHTSMHVPNIIWSFRLTELSEFGFRFGWYVYLLRFNCSCFFSNFKYRDIGPWETDWISIT